MIVQKLTLADDTAATYQEEADTRKLPLIAVLAERLEHAQSLDPRQRFLIIEGRNRERLEKILGDLPLLDVEDLIGKVHRRARIRFGDIDIQLTPGQMEELTWRATKRGKSVQELIEDTVAVFAQNFFTLIPAEK